MKTLEFYQNADLQTLIPTTMTAKDNTKKVVMIPKNELWYESNIYSGHKKSGFKIDKLFKALDSRGLNYKSVSYPFI